MQALRRGGEGEICCCCLHSPRSPLSRHRSATNSPTFNSLSLLHLTLTRASPLVVMELLWVVLVLLAGALAGFFTARGTKRRERGKERKGEEREGDESGC